MTASIVWLRPAAVTGRASRPALPLPPAEPFPVSGARLERPSGENSGASIVGLDGSPLIPEAWPPRLPDDVVEFVALPGALVWRRRGEDESGFVSRVNAVAKAAGLETVRVWKISNVGF